MNVFLLSIPSAGLGKSPQTWRGMKVLLIRSNENNAKAFAQYWLTVTVKECSHELMMMSQSSNFSWTTMAGITRFHCPKNIEWMTLTELSRTSSFIARVREVAVCFASAFLHTMLLLTFQQPLESKYNYSFLLLELTQTHKWVCDSSYLRFCNAVLHKLWC